MLDWFTTIPGILIICGVILLIIAIILFIVGAKKSKKEEMASVQTITEKPVDTTGTVQNVQSSESVQQVPITENVVNTTPVQPVVVENANPSVDVVPVNVEEVVTLNEPVQVNVPETAQIVTPEVNAQQTIVDTPVMPVQEPVVEMPTVTEPVMDIPTAPVENNSNVYGGEATAVNFSVNEEKPVTIYGGNDPLEATQTLPKFSESHVPYGGNYPEARVVEPVQPTVMPTPVEEVVPAISAVEQSVVSVPSVEPTVMQNSVVEPMITNTQEVVNPAPSIVVEPTPVVQPMPEQVKTIVEEL